MFRLGVIFLVFSLMVLALGGGILTGAATVAANMIFVVGLILFVTGLGARRTCIRCAATALRAIEDVDPSTKLI